MKTFTFRLFGKITLFDIQITDWDIETFEDEYDSIPVQPEITLPSHNPMEGRIILRPQD